MNILVTGDSGLIGSHLVDQLVKSHTVQGLSRSTRNPNPECKRYGVDALDKQKTKEIIAEVAPEVVVHLAANAAEGKSVFSPIEITENNINVFWNILVPAIKAGRLKRFVFVSSIAVYGSIHVPFREQDLPIPQDIYGINKLSIENSLRIMSQVHNFEYVIVRPHNVYGPRQNMTDPYRNVVTLFMNELLKGRAYNIFGDGSMLRCFSYVEDVVRVIAQCVNEDVAGLTFNVGSDHSYTIKELSDIVQMVSKIKIPPNYLPDRVQEVHFAKSDHTLVKKVLGYEDTPLITGITHTWRWAKAQGPQEYRYSELELINDKVPQSWK